MLEDFTGNTGEGYVCVCARACVRARVWGVWGLQLFLFSIQGGFDVQHVREGFGNGCHVAFTAKFLRGVAFPATEGFVELSVQEIHLVPRVCD